MKQDIIERFTRYVKIDTQSNAQSQTVPSTPGQLELGNLLVEELKAMGLSEVTIDANGYVMATLPANTDKQVPVIGFLSHLDTATDFTGKNVNPQVHENFDGKAITLNKELGVVLTPELFPELPSYKGH
ncbi:peptidase T, partial [Brevibacillus laterosporus]|nr:peptidase T [Brevibacillus laterosporus]